MHADRFFFDTNILVYSLMPGELGKQRQAEDLMHRAVATGTGVVSYQVVQEFVNVALHRFRRTVAPTDISGLIETWLAPMLAVQSSLELFRAGMQLAMRYQLAWYDALIVAAAEQAHCRILYSEDLQPGQRFDRVRVVNPFLV